MANRVLAEEVKAIMGSCDALIVEIEPFITTANLHISNVFAECTVPDATLKELEKWLTAHLVAITICRTTKTEQLGDAKVDYAGWWGMDLSMSQYGQMVLLLDTTGEIKRQSKKSAMIHAVTSFNT